MPLESDFWSDEKGQVSAEMLIIIAALIGVAIVLIGQLQSSAKTGAKNLGEKTDKAWDAVDKIGK
jgi:Flp pilus assembly pilin Flp